MGRQRYSVDKRCSSTHDNYQELCVYLKEQNARLSSQPNGTIVDGALQFTNQGKYLPQLDRDLQPVVDPTCLKPKGPIDFDYAQYEKIKSIGDLDTKQLIVSRKYNKEMHEIYMQCLNFEREESDHDEKQLQKTYNHAKIKKDNRSFTDQKEISKIKLRKNSLPDFTPANLGYNVKKGPIPFPKSSFKKKTLTKEPILPYEIPIPSSRAFKTLQLANVPELLLKCRQIQSDTKISKDIRRLSSQSSLNFTQLSTDLEMTRHQLES